VRYETANAFRTALEQRLKNEAQATGVALLRLRKRVAFERFLARLATSESSGWVLKAHSRWSCPMASRPERRRTSTLGEPTTLLALSAVSVAVSEFSMALRQVGFLSAKWQSVSRHWFYGGARIFSSSDAWLVLTALRPPRG
jgi:hypothetical protein